LNGFCWQFALFLIDLQPTKIHNPLSLPNCNTKVLGQVYQYFEEIDSTQSILKNLPSEKLADGMLVRAGFQSQGRGQMGSSWEAKANENLTFSVYIEPNRWNLTSPWQLSMWVAVALCQTIQKLLPEAEVRIKWPNDILVHQEKVAGILVENSFRGEHWQNSIIGIGWNILQQNFDPQFSATSMFLAHSTVTDPSACLVSFLEQWEKVPSAHLQNQYLDLLWMKDQWQSIRIEQEERMGCIRNVDENGRLLVEWEDGKVGSYGLKELQFLR